MPGYYDYFSKTAEGYATYRPRYPEQLFDWLVQQTPEADRAWDCGTGNGQAAVSLAKRYREVIATDPSEAQVVHAESRANIKYVVMSAEQVALRDHSTSMVTVAQALHWFALEQFYPEAKRVLRPGGILAVWTYQICTLGDPALNARLEAFYKGEMGPWWPAERALVDAGYAGIPFPFREVTPPRMIMEADWTIEHFAGYVSTWSAVTRCRTKSGVDPVPPFIADLAPNWGNSRRVQWPLELRVGVSEG